jgi:hypothetical protein
MSNNNNSKTTSRKVIITRKPSISEEQCSIKTTEENNNLHITLNGLSNKLPQQQQMLFSENGLGMGNVNRCYNTNVIKTEIQQLQQHDQMTLLGSPPTKYRRFLSPPPPQLQDCNVFSQQGRS